MTCVNPNVIGELKKSDGKIERRIREYSQHYIINIYVYIYIYVEHLIGEEYYHKAIERSSG